MIKPFRNYPGRSQNIRPLFIFLFLIPCSLFFIPSCKTTKNLSSSHPSFTLDTLTVSAVAPAEPYNPSTTKIHHLLHTKLDVRFDWEKQYMYGKAILFLKPYFYPQTTLDLDAKGFTVHRVALLRKNDSLNSSHSSSTPLSFGEGLGVRLDTLDLKYSYDSLQLHIFLDKEYTRKDTFSIYIDYTARPNERKSKGSVAITSDKGLYFINPDGKDSTKPKQIWTQGETEANSCWFPTIDAPNEKMTQEIAITVDKNYITLSNGLLQHQAENSDGTRTDYWKQDLPHSPYLAMMAIGEYAEIKDKWKNMEVNYYVEKDYEKYAKNIFGNTVEMLSFFSEKLGVEYPWQKFSQVVVRDYVSGAMENTTVVIHGEFLQQTDREMLDNNFEDVISHELFHHWFGDLVTCESWANLPLNESFATLGEYLWIEYKYGREDADYHLQQDFASYFAEAEKKQEDLIRFNYSDKEDMFDRHSYQKGGAILNMLRRYVGDEAFFESLKSYLSKHQFANAEVHDLRLAFEEITGEDLNWFFNQWFLNSGHPQIVISYDYNESMQIQKVIIEQSQDFKTNPLYRIPLSVDIYVNGKKQRHGVVVTKEHEEFSFPVNAKPDLVNVDAEKMLLCNKIDKKEASSWVYQYYHAPLYMDRYEAVLRCAALARTDSFAAGVVTDALRDNHWNIREAALRSLDFISLEAAKSNKKAVMEMAGNDKKSSVRAAAIRALHKRYKDEEVMSIYSNAMEDLSYMVMSEALTALSEDNMEEGLKWARRLEAEGETSMSIMGSVAMIYAEKGGDTESAFFEKHMKKSDGFGKIAISLAYEKYLKNENLSDHIVLQGIETLKKMVKEDESFYVKLYGIQSLKNLHSEFSKRETALEDSLSKLGKSQTETTAPGGQREALTNRLNRLAAQRKVLADALETLKKTEEEQRMHFNFGN